jgi:hypothetical protein
MLRFSPCNLRADIVAVLTAMASSAIAAPTFDANLELDSTYNSGSGLASTTLGAVNTGMDQTGRLEVNIAQKAGSEYFVAGRATFLAQKSGTAANDDLWAQLGTSTASIKLGRFEAADLFPVPQDTVVNHAGTVYLTNLLKGRSDKFHLAGVFSPAGALSYELGIIDATNFALSTALSAGGLGAKGARPVISYVSSPVTVKLGLEIGKYLSGRDVNGMGFTAGYATNGMEFHVNLAQANRDAATDNKMRSLAVNALFGRFFAGYIVANNDQTGGNTLIQTVHASYNIPIFGIAGASITPAISHSTAKDSVLGQTLDVDAIRVRLHFDF